MYRVKKESTLLTFLKEKTALSGRVIKQALEQGACRLNGHLERFGSTRLHIGDAVTFHLPKPSPKKALSILHQDPFLTLFNKPSGAVTHPEAGHFLVHRLDKGTSGVLLMARTPSMKKALEGLFKKREVEKIYIALVQGCPNRSQGTIENQLGKKGAFHGQTLYGSVPKGQRAVTHWKVLQKGKKSALIELRPETGRTHQLRVHLSEMGHPILGDLQYGREAVYPSSINRLCLHAYRLTFTHPETGKKVQATAPIPRLFRD